MTISKHTTPITSMAAATVTVTVADGDSTSAPFTEADYLIFTSSDDTKRVYVFVNGASSSVATGTVMVAGDDTGASTLSAATAALGTCVAISNNFSSHSQALYLNELKAAIVHANGHNSKITAGADVVAADGALSIIFTQAVAGAAGNTAVINGTTGSVITMTGGYRSSPNKGFTGGDVSTAPVDNNGGVIANAGTLTGLNRQITSKSLLDLVKGADSSGTRPVVTTGSAHRPGIQAALVSGGSFGFNPANVTRSKTDTGFIMSHVPSLLAGKAATGDLMAIPAGHYTSSVAGNLHPKVNTYQKGTWATQVFNLFPDPGGHGGYGNGSDAGLRQSDNTAKSGITSRGSSLTFHNNRSTTHVDHAAQKASATRGVPGEFLILTNFVGWKITVAGNQSTSGDGTGATNYMDYSALTG